MQICTILKQLKFNEPTVKLELNPRLIWWQVREETKLFTNVGTNVFALFGKKRKNIFFLVTFRDENKIFLPAQLGALEKAISLAIHSHLDQKTSSAS